MMFRRKFPKYLFAAALTLAASFECVSAADGCPVNFVQAGGYFVQFGPRVSHMDFADFNSDGNLDMVVAHDSANSLVFLPGDGTGQLGTPASFTAGTRPTSFAISDFNSDGKNDLAITNGGSGNVSILLGDGAGRFSAPANIDVGPLPNFVVAGDFNGDGRRDLAVTYNGFCNIETCFASKVAILLGNGAGGFSVSSRFDSGSGPVSIAVGDFDGDGRSDLAVGSTLMIWLGDGTGSFSSRPPTNLGASGTFAVGDFNGDGKADLANVGDGIALGDGTGSFSMSPEPALLSAGSVVLADFNGDGRLDVASSTNGGLSVHLGDGKGGLGSPVEIAAKGTHQPPAKNVAAGDLDSDGKPDLSYASAGLAVPTLLNRTRAGCAPSVSLFQRDVWVTEGGGNAAVTVHLVPPADTTVTVNFTTLEGSAKSGLDFTPVSGTLTFLPGATAQTITIPIINDSLVEPDESFSVVLSNAVNAELVTHAPPPRVAIRSDDRLPTLSVSNATVLEPDVANVKAIFTFSLSFPSDTEVRVACRTGDHSAISTGSHADYEPLGVTSPHVVSFAPGETSKTVEVIVHGDIRVERDEGFGLYLESPSGASGQPEQAFGTIVDDDAPLIATQENTDRAIALDAVTFLSAPFTIVNTYNFSTDQRTRIMLFVENIEAFPGGVAGVVTAEAEDSQGRVYQLPVEFGGKIPQFNHLTQVVVKLTGELQNAVGDVRIGLKLRGIVGNKALVRIAP